MTRQSTKLRILATTDLHMNLQGFDYARDCPSNENGLAGLATAIRAARAEGAAEGRTTLLFDNGDFLQGTALADALANRTDRSPHPLIEVFNALAYDAIGLGNHDLDYGLEYLGKIAAQSAAPMICSNLASERQICGGAIKPDALLVRNMPTSDGTVDLRIGVVSVLPSETAIWNAAQLNPDVTVRDAQERARAAVHALRHSGADIVIVLAHMGLGDTTGPASGGAAGAAHLAQIAGIDAVIAGHTHRHFPRGDPALSSDGAGGSGTDGCPPIVMPGVAGSHLGLIDLDLERASGGGPWAVARRHVTLRAASVSVPAAPDILTMIGPVHEAARSTLGREIGQTHQRLHSYFTFAGPTQPMALAARAKALVVGAALRGTPDGKLPLLATATARAAGGSGGPEHFADIAPGPVLRRDLVGLVQTVNQIWAIRVTGAQIRSWLERSAEGYTRLRLGTADQPLLDPKVPAFNFDAIYGISYKINPTRPIGERITDLTHAGTPLRASDHFVLATNHFRASGGGGFPQTAPGDVILRSQVSPLQAFQKALTVEPAEIWETPETWMLGADGAATAVLQTSRKALLYLDEITRFAPQSLGQNPEGFAQIRLTL